MEVLAKADHSHVRDRLGLGGDQVAEEGWQSVVPRIYRHWVESCLSEGSEYRLLIDLARSEENMQSKVALVGFAGTVLNVGFHAERVCSISTWA